MKIMTKVTWVTIACLVLTVSICSAKVVVIDASSDADVKSDAPNSTFATSTELLPQATGAPYGSSGTLYYTFMQFELPDDIESIISADITVVQLEGSSITYYVYGLLDATPQPSVDTYTWNTAPGYDPGYTILTLGHTEYFDPAEAEWVGNYYSSGLGELGLGYNLPLIPFLENDTDGIVTFYMKKRQNYAIDKTFASIEHATEHGPQLVLEYVQQAPAQVVLDPDIGVSVTEGSATNYNVSLSSVPTDTVTVQLSYDDTQINVSPTSLIFEIGDYDTPQPVTVTALNDAIPEIDTVYQIEHAAFSNDINYQLCPLAQLPATVLDNDASLVTLTATADSMVYSTSPDTAFPTGDLDPRKDLDPNGYAYAYVQFQLPNDFEFALDAGMTVVNINPAGVSGYVYVIALNDDVVAGDVGTYTWNTAPGIDYAAFAAPSGGLNGFDAATSTWACSILVDAGAAVGDTIPSVEASHYALVNRLNEDTDKVLTLFMIRNDLGSNVDVFASTENANYNAPQLELLYSSVGYCGQPGSGYPVGDINQDCRVNMVDFSLMGQP